MENTTDPLKVKIEQAKNELSEETRKAIDAVDVRTIILGMNGKYNSEQIEDLETETELLLCGLSTPENYQKELQLRMKISTNEVLLLLAELDKNIFKKIQVELEKILSEEEAVKNKPFVADPLFAELPMETQKSIAKSGWKVNLYKIGQKNKLPVDKLGQLEKSTIKIIKGEINPGEYEEELKSKLGLSENDINTLVNEINEKILINIRKSLKQDWNNNKTNEDIPLPPKEEPKDIYKEAGIEISKNENATSNSNNENEITHKEDFILASSGINMLKNKLTNTTASTNTTSNYSIPKMSNLNSQVPQAPIQGPTNSHDPYHEPI